MKPRLISVARYGVVASIALLGVTAPLQAQDIVSLSSSILLLTTPPTSLLNNQLTSNTSIFAFRERQKVILSQDVTVNDVPPTSGTGSIASGVIPAGTYLSSFFLHIDPVGSPTIPVRYIGAITFANPILGIIVQGNKSATNGLLGLPGVIYNNRAPFDAQGDAYTLSADGRTLTIDTRTVAGQDSMRVLVAEAPEPASVWGMCLGITTLGLVRRRK